MVDTNTFTFIQKQIQSSLRPMTIKTVQSMLGGDPVKGFRSNVNLTFTYGVVTPCQALGTA